MATTPSKGGRRFDEEFKREVAALADKPGAKQEQAASDPGVSPYRVARWKKPSASVPAASAPGVSVAELERRIRSLERENADLREQRTILKKKRSPSSPNLRDEDRRDQSLGGAAPDAKALPHPRAWFQACAAQATATTTPGWRGGLRHSRRLGSGRR